MITFICGNDGFRDYELAENLTQLMLSKLYFVSEMIDEKNYKIK